jgi:hypothetical protein
VEAHLASLQGERFTQDGTDAALTMPELLKLIRKQKVTRETLLHCPGPPGRVSVLHIFHSKTSLYLWRCCMGAQDA